VDLFLPVFHTVVGTEVAAMRGGGRLTLVSRLRFNPLFDMVDLGLGQRSLGDILVLDAGRGIPVGAGARLFTPFFTTKDKGLGLGLALCHRIIEEHRGAIQIASESGRGTAVSCFLPIAR
jgi:two-component system nitrogen regulation sensor histidine kinase GlnL